MATKFRLQPNPTFKADVSIPRAGEEDGKLTFTFRHKPFKDVGPECLEGKNAVDFIMDITEAWALPEAFSRENMEVLLDNYPGAFNAITTKFYSELMGQREKN